MVDNRLDKILDNNSFLFGCTAKFKKTPTGSHTFLLPCLVLRETLHTIASDDYYNFMKQQKLLINQDEPSNC